MPLYEYQCKACGHRFEKIQTYSAAEIKECPKCAGEVEKLISAPAIQFKGSGWYVSDYGKGGAAGSNTKPDTQKSGDSNKSDGGTAKSDASSGSGDSKSGGESKSSGDTKAASSPSAPVSSGSSSSAAPASSTGSGSKKD